MELSIVLDEQMPTNELNVTVTQSKLTVRTSPGVQPQVLAVLEIETALAVLDGLVDKERGAPPRTRERAEKVRQILLDTGSVPPDDPRLNPERGE